MSREDGLRHRMAEKHEQDLANWLGGRKTRGSGNQPANPLDGRQNHYEIEPAFAWDGKSTRGKSIGVSRAMWEQVVEDSHSELPMLALRYYDSDRLAVGLDLVVIDMMTFTELRDMGNQGIH